MLRGQITLAAGLLLAMICGSASADAVRFEIIGGVFASSNQASTTYHSGNSTATVSFTKAAGIFAYDLMSEEIEILSGTDRLGYFTVSQNGNANINVDDDFTLTIKVYDPINAGSGSTFGTVSGKLKNGDGGKDLNIALPNLTLPAAGLPNLQFSFFPATLSSIAGQNTQSLTGAVKYNGPETHAVAASVAVPLPASAWSALALLAAVALVGRRRRLAMH